MHPDERHARGATRATPGPTWLWLGLAFGAFACTGVVGGDGKKGGNTGSGSPGQDPSSGAPGPTDPRSSPPGMEAPAPPSVSAAVAPMRRLTRAQYRNTVRDLVGVDDAVDPASLPGDEAILDRFRSNAQSPLQPIDVGKYADAADAVARKAVANLATLVPCDATADRAACARSFLQSFGKRAYRRPLSPEELSLMQAVYDAGGDFETGIRLVLTAVLQSPKFLYLREPVAANAAGRIVAVDPWALASRLSYFLVGSMPDQELFSAAETGKLGNAADVGLQAQRLMRDARFRATVSAFHRDWLQLETLPGTEKDKQLFPTWGPALRDALGEELRRFVEHVVSEGDGRLETLLTASYSFLSGPLFGHYGVSGSGDWQQVELPKDQRAGLFTQAALLATLSHDNRTSYILRGKMLREGLFCSPQLVAPPDVAAEPQVDPNASAKARSEAHRKDPQCATCHELFDPLGFAFETYDATGKYRAGAALDTAVTLSHTKALDGKTARDAVELMRLLAGADEVKDCVARQWMRFALGRDGVAEDEPALARAARDFRNGGGKLTDLVVALVRSDAFLFQKGPQP